MRLTVVCLLFAMVLVFVGTVAQVNHGIYLVQKEYFQSFVVFWGPKGAGWRIPILPGGYLIGTVLLLNLVLAQVRDFAFSRTKIGLYLTHLGMILLLVGQLATDMMQVESHMRLVEGQGKNYSESSFDHELVIAQSAQSELEKVVAIPEVLLGKKDEIAQPELPFRIKVNQYYRNSRLEDRPANAPGKAPATQGFGQNINLKQVSVTARTDERNLPSAVVEIVAGEKSLGTWLVSSMIDRRQAVTVDGKTWEIGLRQRRFYKPHTISLIDFTHEKYPGTEIPKNFSSKVKVTNPGTGEEREVLIYMNNPLRYGGETYYQGSYDPNDARVSILQVVRNPAWLTPYVACLMVGVGLTIHFLVSLFAFVRNSALRKSA